MGFGGFSIYSVWVFSLLAAIVAFFLAKAKGKSVPLWVIVGALFPISIVVLALLPGRKSFTEKKELSNSQVEKYVKQFVNKKTGKVKISLEQLASALNINAGNYISNFTPNNNLLANITFGSMAGGASGAAYTAASFVQGAVSSYKAAKLDAGSRYSGFIVVDRDIVILNGLAQLLSKGVLSKQEFMKGAASLAYDSGKGLCSLAEVDAFGSLNFKNDDDRYIAAICYQFFAENTVEKARIEALYNENINSITIENQSASISVTSD
jgi:hypothetical protein